MADLSKVRLNGTVYNFKDAEARLLIETLPLATTSANGLMSATDKQVIDNLNPNVTINITDWYNSDLEIINAKQLNALGLEIKEIPHISSQIRTNNLLDANSYTPGFYIGSNGANSSNANDKLGDFIPVSPGQDIYYTGIVGPTNSSSINRRLHVYNSNQTWIKQLSYAGNLHIGDNWSTHGVIPSNGAYIRVSWGSNDTNIMLSVGAPTKYEPYYLTPFESITSTVFQLANNSAMENATTYTINVPANIGNVYGYNINPIEGKLYLTTEHIASYNNETLPGLWWSDRDVYSAESSPTIGAEVIYELNSNDIVEYNITPIDIPLFYHTNYLHINHGEIVNFSYYAETFAVSHLTVSNGITFGDNQITESSVSGWNHAADLIDTKASAALVGSETLETTNQTVIGAINELNDDKVHQSDLTEVQLSGTKNNSGDAIGAGTYFYLNEVLCRAKTSIANGATFTLGTNYEVVTAGALNELAGGTANGSNDIVRDIVSSSHSVSYTFENNSAAVLFTAGDTNGKGGLYLISTKSKGKLHIKTVEASSITISTDYNRLDISSSNSVFICLMCMYGSFS